MSPRRTDEAGTNPTTPPELVAWNRLRCDGKRLLDRLTAGLPPNLRRAVWQTFQQFPIAQWASWIISETEPQEIGLFPRRTRRPKGWVLFDDLPTDDDRIKALQVFHRLCAQKGLQLPRDAWLVPILAGRARDLLLRPEAHGADWGRQNLRRLRGKRSWQKRVQRDPEAAHQHMRDISRLGMRARQLESD